MTTRNSPNNDNATPVIGRREDSTSRDVTDVELTWIEKRVEMWLRFGRPVATRNIDPQKRIVSFAPGSVFALVRWVGGDYGTIASRLDIIRAVDPSEAMQTLPFIRPGGELLLRVNGWARVERVLQLVDVIEAIELDPTDVAPDYWRHVQNRVAAGELPRDYTAIRHRAFLKRRSVEL